VSLTGSGTANRLTGGSAADAIDGGGGSDTLNGGGGDDQITADDSDLIDGGADSDTVSFAAAVVAANLADGDLTNVENITITNAGAASYDFSAQIEALNITGGNAADTLTGSTASDTIDGGGGNDFIIYSDADNIVSGGADTDTLVVSAAATINLANADQTSGDIANVTAFENVDASASSAAVSLTGSGTANRLTGGSAADAIDGGSGSDTLNGGDGGDQITADDSDVIDGGADSDTVSFAAAVVAANLADGDLTNVENITITNAGAASYDFSGQSEALNISGGSANDTITGGSASDTFSGGGGNDVLIAADNDALIDGGMGSNTARFGAAVTGANLTDAKLVNVQSIAITNASAAAYDFSPQTEALSITGGDANDTITGGSDYDTIDGGAGADSLIGGAGNDVIYWSPGSDSAVGGAGTDTLLTSNTVLINADFSTVSGFEILSLTGTGQQTLTLGANTNTTFTSGIEITMASTIASINLNGASSNVSVIISGASGGNDTITGGSASDTLRGGDGNDSIRGGNSGDYLLGGDGADTLAGGTGTDILDGGAGADVFQYFATTENSSGGPSETVFDTITGYQFADSGSSFVGDKLDLSGTPAVRTNQSNIDVATASGNPSTTIIASVSAGIITLSGTDSGLVDTLGEWFGVARGVVTTGTNIAAFVYGSDTYLYHELGNNNNDTLIRLAGITGVTGFTVGGSAGTSSTIWVS
jgi:Ca2+-binding RTX toxin-like protein